MRHLTPCLAALLLLTSSAAFGQRRKVIFDQDCAGPGGTDLQSLLVMIQSPDVSVLGITVVTGDQWRDEEIAHTLRLLEIIGRTDIPVVPGAVFPLVNTREATEVWEQRYGQLAYIGAWDKRWWHEASVVPPLAEGQPHTKPSDEDAAHFLVRMVRKYPHQITIYAGGPMTNLVLAISLDPQFPELAQGLVFMGGSISPQSDDPEFANNPRHEFNMWFDPEAASVVLRAPWKKIVCTTVDISIKTRLSQQAMNRIAASDTDLARYLSRFYRANYMWDELAAAAWIDPSLITKRETRYMNVDLDRGAGYGNTLIWTENDKPKITVQPVEIQVDLDIEKFYEMFVRLMSARTPAAH
ncbi:MAG: nucleoside hydrolase [Acidobacteriaceae bacterium]|nr:nucleoside hydrolase [Acidobacteriaceae bacterium]MBV9780295.1 nucleoside hydrolase [Acidobacteriaceae bacterium]